jgi:hypothetical protein
VAVALGNAGLNAQPLQLSALTQPALTDYYLAPNSMETYIGAPGCSTILPQPQCGTMFPDLYQPILSLPKQVSGLLDNWSSCLPAIFGVYDPPSALSAVTTIAGPTVDPARTSASSIDDSSTTSVPAAAAQTGSSPTPAPTSTSTSSQKASQSQSNAPTSTSTSSPNENQSQPTASILAASATSEDRPSSQDTASTASSQPQSAAKTPSSLPSGSTSPAEETQTPSESIQSITTNAPNALDPSSSPANPKTPATAPSASDASAGGPSEPSTHFESPPGTQADHASASSNDPSDNQPSATRVQISNILSALTEIAGSTSGPEGAQSSAADPSGATGRPATDPGNLPAGSTQRDPQISAATSAIVLSGTNQQFTVSTAGQGGVAIGSVSLSSGGAATVNDQTVSNPGDGSVVIGTSTTAVGSAITVSGTSQQFTVSTTSQGGVAMGSVSLSSGEVATVNGQTVSNPGDGRVVIGTSTAVVPNDATNTALDDPPAATVSGTGQPFTISKATSGAVVAGSVSLSSGEATTMNGQTLTSAGDGRVIIGTQTVALPSGPSSAVVIDPASTVFTGDPPVSTIFGPDGQLTMSAATGGVVVANGISLSSGQVTTNNGQTLSNPGNGNLVVGSSTVSLAGPSVSGSDLVDPISQTGAPEGQFTISTVSGGVAVINGDTLSSGQATTINGQTLSNPGNGDIQIGTSTLSLANAPDGTTVLDPAATVASSAVVVTMSDATFTIARASAADSGVSSATRASSTSGVETVDGSILLTLGGAPKTINGTSLSAASGGVVIDGSTIILTAASTTGTGSASSSTAASSSGALNTAAGHGSATSSGKTSDASSRWVLERRMPVSAVMIVGIWLVLR